MMNWRAIGAASVMAFFATLSTVSSAQDIRSQQAAMEKELAALNQQISAKQQQITALRNKPSPEQAEVAAAQKVLDSARAELKAVPGPDNEGKVRNAEFKLKLAQLKYDKSNGGIETLNDDIDRLKQQVSAKQQQVKELSAQSSEHAQAQQQQKQADERAKRQQQEQELARAKQEAESAKNEIERLKAALAAKEATQAKAAAPAPAAAPVAKAPEAALKPAAAPQPEAAKATAPAATANASGLIKLNSQDQVLRELQSTAQLSAQAARGESETALIIYMKRPGAKSTNKDKLPLRALGNNQYRASTTVEAGDFEVVIGFNRWNVQFAADEVGEMTFLCDYRDNKAPRLVIYRKALEGGA